VSRFDPSISGSIIGKLQKLILMPRRREGHSVVAGLSGMIFPQHFSFSNLNSVAYRSRI